MRRGPGVRFERVVREREEWSGKDVKSTRRDFWKVEFIVVDV